MNVLFPTSGGARLCRAFLLLCTLVAAPLHDACSQALTPIYNLRRGTNALQGTNWVAIVTAPNQTNGTERFQLSDLSSYFNIQVGAGIDTRLDNIEAITNQIGTAAGAQAGTAGLTNFSASISNTVYWNTATNLAVAWSNLANNTKAIITGGDHVVTPSIYLATGLGAINAYRKTNIIVEIDHNATINGSAALGELLVLTNCDNVIIRGGTWLGRRETNWWEADITQVWHGILLHNNRNVWLDGLRLHNHMDHGIGGLGAQANRNSGNTNNIWLTRIYGSYIGSYRTNNASGYDGTFVVPDGPWNMVELEGYANFRDIEPYSEGDSAPNRWNGGMLINSRFINTMDRSVLSAGSTNNHHFLIAGNYFYREPGFTRFTSNYTATADFVWWNGGDGWTMRGNTFEGHAARAIYITSGVRNGIVEDNKFINLTNTLGSSGHAIQIEEAYRMRVKNNTVIGGEGLPLYLFGTRDSEVVGNWFEDAWGETGIQIATFGGPVTSNIWFEGNTIKGMTNAIWDQGLSGSQNLTFVGNRPDGYTGNAYNLSSTTASEVTIRSYDEHGGTNQLATIGQMVGTSNVLYAAIGSGGSGTNNPVLYAGPIIALIANQTARGQFSTNASFAWTITGASNQSSVAEMELANTSTNTIYATNALAPYVVEYGSNVTTLAIPPTSKLIARTWLNRSNEWVMTTFSAPYSLEFSNGTTATNHTTKTVTYTAPSSGGSSSFNETNITVSTTNEIVVNLAAFDLTRIKLLTNLNTITFSNPATMGKRGQAYIQQDTNGTRAIANWRVAGGVLQMPTNHTTTLTTNANAVDVLELMPGFHNTNAFAWWPQDFHPRIAFTNSLASGMVTLPLELVSNASAGAWSVGRRLTNGWNGALALVVRSSDGATNYLVPSGTSNNISTILSWAGSDDVYATNTFCQAGTGRTLANGDTNTCPLIITNGVAVTSPSGRTVLFARGNPRLRATSVALSLPVTHLFNTYTRSIAAGDIYVAGGSSTRTAIKQGTTTYRFNSGADVNVHTITLNQWDTLRAYFATGTDSFGLDGGSLSTGTAGDNTVTEIELGSPTICADALFGEWMIWNASPTDSEVIAAGANVEAFYE